LGRGARPVGHGVATHDPRGGAGRHRHLQLLQATNEVNFLAQKLARVVFGTHNIDSCNRT